MVSRIIARGLIFQSRRLRFETDVPDRPGALAHLLKVVGDVGANIYSMSQTRQKQEREMMMQMVEFTVELQNTAHKERLLKALADEHYDVRIF